MAIVLAGSPDQPHHRDRSRAGGDLGPSGRGDRRLSGRGRAPGRDVRRVRPAGFGRLAQLQRQPAAGPLVLARLRRRHPQLQHASWPRASIRSTARKRSRRTSAAAFDDLNKNAPPGSWMMNSGNPFLPQHELRANLQTKRLAAEKGIRDAYYRAMFRQFERTRLVTALSPVSLYEYLTEAVAGGGYPRFRKAWTDMHVYQEQFLSFFKALDAGDTASPHWFNP
ncbi:MAG: hypothetical protein MZV63_65070 [Marinilabiliales bacterium]|nr:hypothetical protein [Marinilabiliales bacterium]